MQHLDHALLDELDQLIDSNDGVFNECLAAATAGTRGASGSS